MPKSHERVYTRQCIGRAWAEKLPIKLIVISTENSEMIMEAITITTKLKVREVTQEGVQKFIWLK